VIKLSMFLI